MVSVEEMNKKNVHHIINQETPSEVIVGNMQIEALQVNDQASLVDYLRAGWQLSLSVAIDFTGSNGDPHEPTSLHYLDGCN